MKQKVLRIVKNNAWTAFSKWIKNRDGGSCFTCGEWCEGKNRQAGHFLNANVCNMVMRYDERNVHTQCATCNCYLHGNYPIYRRRMIEVYGLDTVTEMEDTYRLPLPMNFSEREFLEGIILKYGSK